MNEGRRKKEEGRRKEEGGRRKEEEGRKKEEGRRKKEEGRGLDVEPGPQLKTCYLFLVVVLNPTPTYISVMGCG